MCAFLLLSLTLTFSTGGSLRPETPPPRLNIGLVDLVALVSSMPPEAGPAPAAGEPAAARTLAELHRQVESYLGGEVTRAVEGARFRVAWVRRSTSAEPAAGSLQGDPWSALVAVVIGSISYTTNTALRDAKSCLSFLEGYERRVRALHEEVPETDEVVTPELRARWERLSAELKDNTPCRLRRPR